MRHSYYTESTFSHKPTKRNVDPLLLKLLNGL